MKIRLLLASAVAALALSAGAHAQSSFGTSPSPVPYFSWADPGNLTAAMNALIQKIDTLITPQSMAAHNDPRNVLDNGDMAVYQRGTGIATCGTATAPTATAAAADRWFCDVNVTSGAGRSVISTASLPPGYPAWVELYRLSGALTQPVCAMQQLASQEAVSLQGKSVMLSIKHMVDLGGLITDNGGVVNAYIITGTTTADQGFGTLTASPAITPAWTGIAGGATAAATWIISTTDASYKLSAPVVIPTTAVQVGVEICFTPTATGAGVTDGLKMTGVQLEALTGSSIAPSAFDHLSYLVELQKAQRFYYQLNEPAATVPVPITGMAESTTVQYLTLQLPQIMRGTTPVAVITTGTFKEQIATAQTTWVTPTETGAGCSTSACGILTGNTTTALAGITVTGGGGTGVIAVQNDSIM